MNNKEPETDFVSRASILPNTAEAIGLTPLVALDRLTENLNGRILAKLDHLNPGHSKKDRAALQIIRDAEADGSLKPGQQIVELTSGNMGTGLAIVCSALGYPLITVMSKGNSCERAIMMEALGAKVVLVDQEDGSIPGNVTKTDLELSEQEAVRLTEEHEAFRIDQWHRHGNFRSHYLGTGPEIWAQSGGIITGFCDFIGSGGTFGGCTAYFKEQNPDIKCYAVEPDGNAVLAGQDSINPSHPIQGGGYGRTELDHLDGIKPDGYIQITGNASKEAARLLAKTEGIFAGFSTGANIAAAIQLLEGDLAGGIIAVVINDTGLKYLSTDLWD